MIFVIIIGIAGTFLFMNKEVYQRVYRENESIALGYLNFTVKDSFISNLTKDGEILNEDKYYVILQLEITNRYREDHNFNYINLELTVNNKYFLPNLSIGNYFKDYGTPYSGSFIKGNSSNEYILVYEIDKYLINQDFELTVFSHYDASVGGIGSVNNRMSLNPTIVSNKIVTNTIGLGTRLDLSNTNLKNSELTITDYEITNLYRYNYEYCTSNSHCISSTGFYAPEDYRNTLLILGYDLTLDEEIPYMNTTRTYRSVLNDFMKIKYEVNGTVYNHNIIVSNPSNYNEKAIIELPRELNYADHINLIFTVRNISYQITLK